MRRQVELDDVITRCFDRLLHPVESHQEAFRHIVMIERRFVGEEHKQKA
jgi:hypothetical protein